MCITNVPTELSGSLGSAGGLRPGSWLVLCELDQDRLKATWGSVFGEKSAQTTVISFPHRQGLPHSDHSDILSPALGISGGCCYV